MESVAGKRVLVTGAAMGMGRLFAQRAVDEDAHAVVLWDINEAELESAAADLDVSNADAGRAMQSECGHGQRRQPGLP